LALNGYITSESILCTLSRRYGATNKFWDGDFRCTNHRSGFVSNSITVWYAGALTGGLMRRLGPISARIAILLILCGSVAAGSPPGQSSSQHPPAISAERAVINQYCLSCHNDKIKTAGLALDTLSVDTVQDHPEIWEKVLRKVRTRFMPPPGMPRPDEKTY